MKTCPFCCAEIPEKAKKCQYCGEWLVRKNAKIMPSESARAVNRGLKQKEIDDSFYEGCMPWISLFFVVLVYSITDSIRAALIVGAIILILGTIMYFQE
jgi:hypothetical protein